MKISWNFVNLCLWFLLSGIEYAIILPTINEFLELIDDSNEQVYLGIALSAFSLTGLITAPIYGRLTDKTNSLKFTVVFSNLFEIVGNVMYMSAKSSWMVIASRLVAGIGSGSGSSIFGVVSKTTSKEERTSKMAQLMSVRQIGLLVGPAFNFCLMKMNFDMGSIHINNLSGAGFFMAVLWTLYSLLMLVFYKDVKPTEEEADTDTNSEAASLIKSNRNGYGAIDTSNRAGGCSSDTNDQQMPVNTQSWSNIFHDLFREEVIVCLACTFFIMFIQTAFEAVLTPLTAQYFEWNSIGNSLFFLGGGIDVLVAFFVMARISRWVSDRKMILVGFANCFVLLVIFIPLVYFAAKYPPETPWIYGAFITHSVLFIFNLPFLFTPHVSLFSKLTNVHTQAFNQGIRISVRGVGQIIGPLWASSLMGDYLPYMCAVNCFSCGIILVMIILSYDRLEIDLSADQDGETEAVNA